MSLGTKSSGGSAGDDKEAAAAAATAASEGEEWAEAVRARKSKS